MEYGPILAQAGVDSAGLALQTYIRSISTNSISTILIEKSTIHEIPLIELQERIIVG